MKLLDIITRLCAADGLSGREQSAADMAQNIISELGLGRTSITPTGSLICHMPCKDQNARPIMLEAHLDQVGFVITRVEDGFLRFQNSGGIDRRMLPAQRVNIYAESGVFSGVIASVPPHLKDSSSDTPPKMSDMLIDTGYSPERAAELFAPGDVAILQGEMTALHGGRLAGVALDDRAGCAAVIWAGKLLLERGCDRPVVLALCSHEEVGGQGAATVAFGCDPAACYSVDVSYGDAPDVPAHKCGKLGGGPMVGFSPVLSRAMSNRLCDIARTLDMPIQREIMGGLTGTDADKVIMTRTGVPTALLSIPLRNMHTAVESADISDIEATALLMAEAVLGGEGL